jgi:hypothetical protein
MELRNQTIKLAEQEGVTIPFNDYQLQDLRLEPHEAEQLVTDVYE